MTSVIGRHQKELTERSLQSLFAPTFAPLFSKRDYPDQPMNGKTLEKKYTKVALLFQPLELEVPLTVLQLLHIHKSEKGIDYTLYPISRSELHRQYASLPEEAKAVLLKFQPEAASELRQATEQRHKKQKAGVPLQPFVLSAFHRHWHQQFSCLKPFFTHLRCYHKIRKPNTSLFQTLPCRFRTEKPRLSFEVVREDARLSLHTKVTINDSSNAITVFNRYTFFLEKDNEYFLLSYGDYLTLQWLEKTDPAQYATDSAAFAERILARLESDYIVNRNKLFEEKQVETLPACRVLLTELNNSFLLLTPQWLYDGLLVDGPWKEKQEILAGGERVVICRHREAEESFRQLLASLHPRFANQFNGYYYLPFAEAQKKQWFLKAYHNLLDRNIEVTGMDLLQHFKYSSHRAETRFAIQGETGNQVLLRMSVTFGKEPVSLALLQKTLWAGQRAVVLKDGSLGVFSDEWLLQYATLLKHGKIKGTEIEVSKFLALGESGKESHAVWAPLKEDWQVKWQRWQSDEEPLYPLPATIQGELRPYQRKGFEWLVLLAEIGAGGCLADDMGLGKTLQTICFLAWYCELHPTTQQIIVCPTSLVYNWQQELKKFAPSLSVEIFHGTARNTTPTAANILITSYGTLRSNSEVLLSRTFGVAVLDESHTIKNPSAQVTRLTQGLEASMRIALSGTPVVNNTFDLYAQFSFALPGLFGSREFFKREYADPIDRWGDEVKIKALQRLTAPFVLRRTKEQVAPDLPAKTETVLWCTMSAGQEALYQEVRDQIRSNLLGEIQNNGLSKTKLAVLQGLLKLRQICNDPQLLPAEEHAGRLDSVKTEVLMEEVTQVLEHHRVLVFSQFSSMLHLLSGECRRRGIAYYLLEGATHADKRMEMVRNFQENSDSPRLFLISLKAGNTGLTLTEADYVFLFDPWWNTAVEQQAIDRTHRIGQTKKVFSYKLICRNTVEERILELQARKKHLAEELIGEEEGFVKALSEEDIAYLLN